MILKKLNVFKWEISTLKMIALTYSSDAKTNKQRQSWDTKPGESHFQNTCHLTSIRFSALLNNIKNETKEETAQKAPQSIAGCPSFTSASFVREKHLQPKNKRELSGDGWAV